jgi:polar amino acid transport system permease protein
MVFEYDWIEQYADLILRGIVMTIMLSVVGGLSGVILGILGNRVLWSGGQAVRSSITAIVEVLRNTPFLIQLYFIYFGLPGMGIRLGPLQAAMFAMIVNVAAYSTEIIRAGLQATPTGQVEAGLSLGMSRGQVFWWVQLMPAMWRIWPALSSQLVLVMLGSAVVSAISVEDLSFAANFIQSRNFRAFETYFFLTLVYLVLSFAYRFVLNLVGRAVFQQGSKL